MGEPALTLANQSLAQKCARPVNQMALSFNDILLPRDDACFVQAKVLGG
jgi:hypothetical protein